MARHHPEPAHQTRHARLNEKGRGILLMHDIHPATAMALPMLLKELKSQGYHVVQVVPAGERPASVPELVASPAEDKGNWPRVLKTSAAAVADGNKPTLRHHVKKAHAGKHRRAAVASRTRAGARLRHGARLAVAPVLGFVFRRAMTPSKP